MARTVSMKRCAKLMENWKGWDQGEWPFTPAARLFLDRGWRFLAAKMEQRVDTQPPHQDFKQWLASLRPVVLDGIRDDGNMIVRA